MTPEQHRDRDIALSLGPEIWLLRWRERSTPDGRWEAANFYLLCLDREASRESRAA